LRLPILTGSGWAPNDGVHTNGANAWMRPESSCSITAAVGKKFHGLFS
jgi:hypothetical protein